VSTQAVGEFGRLDILVNNAMADPGLSLIPFMETTDAHMDNYWQSGPLATFHFMQVCYPHMRGHDSAIVNVGSRAGSTRPIDRAGDCELDIGRTVVYLASELSAFVTGHTVMVDGGSCRF
jgi:NAD(P)-dependent dehydrogenase (short-subunit alcohol dehydrogenase family)